MPPPARFLINLIKFPLLYSGSQNIIHHRAEHVLAVDPEVGGGLNTFVSAQFH
jgi:hypothetical protein